MNLSITKLYLLLLLSGAATMLHAQKINRYSTDEMELIYFGDRYSYIMPHVAGTFHNAMYFHKKHWNYQHKKTFVILTDFEDDGHGGANVMPENMIMLGISPFNFAFSITPSSERFQWLFNHEFTHITMADHANKRDRLWRSMFFGKVIREEEKPLTALWSYFTTPRWYAPRWFHEGIACYMETWMSGGIGRTLGPYDEMYFRSLVSEGEKIYSVVGLETEGTTVDFQVGANAYLYGTRFVTYLSQKHGEDKIKELYTRDNDSKAFYAAQFRKVFGTSVNKEWKEWIAFEQEFQKQNLASIKEFPLTPFRQITPQPMGSFSKIAFDAKEQKIYAAVNHPGSISRIVEMDLCSGKTKKIATLDSPMLYSVAYLAYDPTEKQLFISEQNYKFRSLVKVDIKTGKKERLIKISRTADLVFNPVDRCLWGVKHDNGYASLVKIPAPYREVIPMYTAEFGKSLLDLSVSNDGKKLSATLTGISGEQSLIMFDMAELETGSKEYEIIHELEDNTLTQFRFSGDDKYLIGSSYYTGVSNIWRISVDTKEFELLSNDESGLFMPQQIAEDSLFVLKFRRDGMQPGVIPIKVLHDANAISYLGNKVIEKSPAVYDYSLPAASKMKLDSLKTSEAVYVPAKNMRLVNAYPDIAGFKESIAVGYRINIRDRIGLSGMQFFIAGSPWSHYPNKQQLHLEMELHYWSWTLQAAWNKTNFYDLFGPLKRSRAGYSIGLNYHKLFSLRAPFRWNYGFGMHHYGDLEVLPQFQEIESPVKSFQMASAEFGLSKLRRSLGAVVDEKGYAWNINAYSYYVNGTFYPSVVSNQDIGWLIPGIRNTSFWLRNSLGQSFGKKGSSFSTFYFGGFRNNYVDWQPAEQYRKTLAFPGVEIDELSAHNFVKSMGELNLKPIRLRNVGTTWLYPTYIKTALFGTHLWMNPDDELASAHVFDAGIQIDLEMVLFSYMKTTWSAGYARKFEDGMGPSEQWMFSVKLLGR